MLYLTSCPEPTCCAPAEVLDRFTLPSTDGPIEHVKTLCARGDVFTVPVDRAPTPASSDRAVEFLRRG